MTSTDILRGARKRLADSGRLLRGQFAVDEAGGVVLSFSEKAVAWCSMGAIQLEYDSGGWAEECAGRDAVSRLARAIGRTSIVRWHDGCGSLEEVLRGFDDAINSGAAGGPTA